MNMNVYKLTGNCKINGESADRMVSGAYTCGIDYYNLVVEYPDYDDEDEDQEEDEDGELI